MHPLDNFFFKLLSTSQFGDLNFLKLLLKANKHITPHQQDERCFFSTSSPQELHTCLPATAEQGFHPQRSKGSSSNFLQNNSPYQGKI